MHSTRLIDISLSASIRVTIDQIKGDLFGSPDDLARVADRGKRRYRAFCMDFDTRVHSITYPIPENWDGSIDASWPENQRKTIEGLRFEFGDRNLPTKVRDFVAIGAKPFSLVGYHNFFFQQARCAFVAGSYYPALTGTCALGERILNHLMIDLREEFRATPEYKQVYRKGSFDDWRLPLEVLKTWDILLPSASEAFWKLHELRNRSIHFNLGTYGSLREDALSAIAQLREIIDKQFGWFGTQPWYIEGMLGATFIKREFETHPFVKRLILPQCPFVGSGCVILPNFQHGDFNDYGEGEFTDEEFREAFNNRDPKSIAGRTGEKLGR